VIFTTCHNLTEIPTQPHNECDSYGISTIENIILGITQGYINL